jgi:site-specific DNA recombinase
VTKVTLLPSSRSHLDHGALPLDTRSVSGAILYIRVSTAEQANEANNLPTQTRKVEDRCKRDSLPILKTFTDAGESARTTDRPQFQAMLEYCRRHRGKVSHIVFADLSRLARNVADQSATLTNFKRLGITAVSCDERIEDTAAGKLSVNLLGVFNQFFSDNLSERTKYRMSVGVKEGRHLHLAPIGYCNGANGSGLQVDSQRAALVRQAFEWVATRSYSLEEVLRRLKLLGLTTRRAGRLINRQTQSRMLRNPIYAGWVVSGDTKARGQHEPIISQELFDAVQDVLDGKSARAVAHKKVNEDFPLRGFVLCAGCGKKLTACWSKGRNERYSRYWCANKQCTAKVSASRDQIENAFLRILGMLVPTQEYLNRLPEIAKNLWALRLARISNERRRLNTALADAKTLNQKILLKNLTGELSEEDFATLKDTVTAQKTEAETQLAALDAETAAMQTLMDGTQREIVDLVGVWRKGGAQQRQELAFSLYPNGLFYSRETLYFEPRNTLLMNAMQEMIAYLRAEMKIGVGNGNRTRNRRSHSPVLCQLSYSHRRG